MVRRVSAPRSPRPPRARSGDRRRAPGVHDDVYRTIVLSDIAAGGGHLVSPAPRGPVRSLPRVAELFAPFAGDAAPQLAERLIGRFGSLGRILSTPLPQLRAAAGEHTAAADAIFGARRLVEAALGEGAGGAPVDGA